jgi:hypothetical protein
MSFVVVLFTSWPLQLFNVTGNMTMNNQMQVFPKGDRRGILRYCTPFVSHKVITYFVSSSSKDKILPQRE